MLGMTLRIRGRWAQFRKPETNNNPLTHDFVTKTALIGLIGAVLGKERVEMRALFPTLSADLLYGVQVNGVVKKESWAFTLRNANNPNDPGDKAPRQMEFLRDPDFKIALMLSNERSAEVFIQFAAAVRSTEACFTPVLGLQNCPAELEWLSGEEVSLGAGRYLTKGFVIRSQATIESVLAPGSQQFRLGFERVPTYQNDKWWNLPDKYQEVVYPSNGADVSAQGEHFVFSSGEKWCLI